MRTIQLALERRDPTAEEFDRYADVYYPAYRDKHLLVRGGIGDQPARYMALIGAFRHMDAAIETKLIEITKETPTE